MHTPQNILLCKKKDYSKLVAAPGILIMADFARAKNIVESPETKKLLRFARVRKRTGVAKVSSKHGGGIRCHFWLWKTNITNELKI